MQKRSFSFYLWLLLVLAFIFQIQIAKAEQKMGLSGRMGLPGINRKTGQLIATDLWGESPIVEINLQDKVNLLGTTFQLGLDGKNLETWLVFGFISTETNDSPHIFSGQMSVRVEGSTNSSSSSIFLGELSSSPTSLDSNVKSTSPIQATQLSREFLGQGKTFYIYKIYFKIPLQAQVTHIPEHISIWTVLCGDLWHIPYALQPATDAEIKLGLQKTAALLANQFALQVQTNETKLISQSQPTNIVPQTVMPEVQLSITRTNGFLLLTFLPAVENAVLEEANPNSRPLTWNPAVTETNHLTNGWYVSPTEAARIYRIKISP